MIGEVVIAGVDDVVDAILGRLRASETGYEELTFAFARVVRQDGRTAFECFAERPVLPHEFAYRSEYHIELADAARREIVAHAEKLGASLVEFHTHPYPIAASFSPSDQSGFREFVPYVWWRLRARPYAAIVVGPDSVDGLAWVARPDAPVRINAVEGATALSACTGLSSIDGDAVI